MNKDFLHKISENMHSFSKGQKRIGNFILSHYDKAAFMTAAKLGESVGVSESTVVRFANEMGYDGYPQLDNGVGLLRSAREELLDEIRYRVEEGLWAKLPQTKRSVTLLTGMAAKEHLEEISREIMKALPFLTLRVKAVKNRFFGETVTVAGLLCGADLVKAAKEENPEILFIPAVSLRHERDLFLDDYSLDRLQKEVGCPVYAIENGIPLLDTIEEICNGR